MTLNFTLSILIFYYKLNVRDLIFIDSFIQGMVIDK